MSSVHSNLEVGTAEPDRVRYAVAGMGGYAAYITDRLLSDTIRPEGRVKLVAVCDPYPERHVERTAMLTERGVAVFHSFEEMLGDQNVEVVWLPLPIELHRPFTELALAAGKHVVCEKPAAGTVADIDAMIAARDASGLLCVVGFQHLYNPAFRRLKQRLLASEFGTPIRASVTGCWPRPKSYFERNSWAGRLKRGDTWVLDSPANNAMAHYINLALFLLGDNEDNSAAIKHVEAELYRANAIENYDTCTLRVTTSRGVVLTIAMTHACAETCQPAVKIVTDKTQVTVHYPTPIVYGSGDSAVSESIPEILPWPVSDAVARHIRGDYSAPTATLESARAHTLLINATSEAAAVVTVPISFIQHTENEVIAIEGIEVALQQCADEGLLLSETKRFPWAKPGGSFEVPQDYRFAGPRSA